MIAYCPGSAPPPCGSALRLPRPLRPRRRRSDQQTIIVVKGLFAIIWRKHRRQKPGAASPPDDEKDPLVVTMNSAHRRIYIDREIAVAAFLDVCARISAGRTAGERL